VTRAGLLYVTSFVAHGILAVGVASLKGARTHENIAISVVESKKAAKPAPETPPPPLPAPEPAKPTAAPKAKAAPAPKPEAPEPAPVSGTSDQAAVPDFGLSLSGGGGAGGLAVPASRPAAPATSATADRVSKKVLAAPAAADECIDPPKKPKVVSINQPAYTTEAREAQIAGKVRIEVTVDATGKVSGARVLEGLGHGLDEAALAAARGATFEPGTKCGKPTSATFVIAIRFAL
jgi:protein TonB